MNKEHIIEKTVELIRQGTVQILPEDGLLKKLQSGKKLVVKFGADPTAPDLHLGHTVVLRKLKQFQDLGHDVVFLIGDFTARVGDPSGRSKTRPQLTQEAIRSNTITYLEQVGRVVDLARVRVHYNSEWLGRLTAVDMINLCGKITVARITEREDFATRIANNQPVGFHELLYPVFQAYDSVELAADIELGGTDQTFNLLFGRYLQEQFNQSPQVIITTPILEGLDGIQKMSKSLGNAIGLTEAPDQVFGKLMSISDTLMWRYFELLLQVPAATIRSNQEQVSAGTLHPMSLKKDMAHAIIAQLWSVQDADYARSQFESLFQKKDYSKAEPITLSTDATNPIWIVDLLKYLGAVSSTSEAKRLIEANAVHVDADIITDFKAQITWHSGMVIKVGKHRIYQIMHKDPV